MALADNCLSSKETELFYTQMYDAYKSVSTETDEGLKWWKNEMPDIVTRSASENLTEPFRVLAVGTGNGKPCDEELLDILSTLKTDVIYTVVEPRAEAIEDFKILVDSKYENVKFEWFQTTFEEYQDRQWTQCVQEFNLIHFVHSLYYFASSSESLKERIVRCYNKMLKEGGTLVTILTNSVIKPIFLYATHLAISQFSDFIIANSSNHVGKIAEEENWSTVVVNKDWKIDLTECFDETSQTGNLILDFLYQTKDARQTIDKERLEKAMKYLESHCEVMEDGSMIANHLGLDITIIRKESSVNHRK